MQTSPLRLVLRSRQALMMSTALQAAAALALVLPAHAQPAPNARPAGGTVTGGSASINRTANNTQVNQSTQRAAINWQSFDVGSQQRVTFSQPNSSAVALNRVTGPDPSQIAGRIDANGQIVLINQSGVNFYKGAQVNTAGLIVTTANMTDTKFMAGGALTFDQPGKPNAKIDNQGTITIKQAGLAALVAPQVANSGTISAKLGHVVLAGAQTATVDLYGDGLLSLDVTNQVTQVPVDKAGNKATALVTNSGVILADGGTVQLTAAAADGIVQNLVQAGGEIRAATAGGHTGTIALNGVGGSIVVEGQLTAPGSTGGAIEVVSNGNVVVASTAKINASGTAGGGVVAVGTTLDRAKGGPSVTPTRTAKNVTVQQGATIAANAGTKGNGGTVTLLSTNATTMAGNIDVRGGKQGGDGGLAEISGSSVSLTGHVDASAPLGKTGTLLLDPLDLTVSDQQPDGTFAITSGATVAADGSPDANTSSWISPSVLEGQSANVSLAATRDLFVSSPVVLKGSSQGLSLQAGRNLDIEASLTVPGLLYLKADTAQKAGDPGSVTINAPISGGTVFLGSTSNLNIEINQPVTSTGASPLITVACDCHVQTTNLGIVLLQAAGGTIEYGPATKDFDQVMLTHDENVFNASLLRFGLSHDPVLGTQALARSLQVGDVAGPISLDGHALELDASGAISQTSGVTLTNVSTLSGSAGSVLLNGGTNGIATLGPFTTSSGDFTLNAAGPLAVAGTLTIAGSLTLTAQSDLSVNSGVSAASAILQAGHDLTLDTGSDVTSGGDLQLLAGHSLDIKSSLSVPGILYAKANTANDPENPGDFTIEQPVSGGTVYLSSTSPNGITIDGTVTSTAPSPLITVACDCFVYSNLSLVLDAPGGVIEYGPATSGFDQTMLSHDESVFHAPLLRFGLSHDPINGTQALAGTLTLGSAAGAISLDGNALELDAAGNISQTSGSFFTNVRALSGSIANSGTLAVDQPGNSIASFGPFTVGSGAITLKDDSALNVAGALSAEKIDITANGSIHLASDVTTGALASGGGATFTLLAGTDGTSYFSAASKIAALNGTSSSLTVNMPDKGGSVTLVSLAAPGTDFFLNLGSGDATGQMDVHNLTLTVSGSGGIAAFTDSTVQGLSGSDAAAKAQIQPIPPSQQYTMNGCEIGAGCPIVGGGGGGGGGGGSGGGGGGSTTQPSSNPPQTTPPTTTASAPPTSVSQPPASNPAASSPGPVVSETPQPSAEPVSLATAPVSSPPSETEQPPANAELLSIGTTASSGLPAVVSSLIEDAAAAFQSADDQKGVPFLDPMRDLSNGPLHDRQEDPDLLLPNVSEKDY